MNFESKLFNIPAVVDASKPDKPIVMEAKTDEDFSDFLRLYYSVYGQQQMLESDKIKKEIKHHRSGRLGEPHVFIIRDEKNKVVAGAEMFIREKDDQKEAYFCYKVVDPNSRGQGLAGELVSGRIKAAQDQGCVEAYSLIAKDNVSALRSIVKDGFVFKGNGMVKSGNEVSRDTYYASYDLQGGSSYQINKADIERANIISSEQELSAVNILIRLDNQDLIEKAFAHGYIGVYIVLPADRADVKQPMMMLQKSVA